MAENQIIKEQLLLSIREKMLCKEIESAVSDLNLLITSLDSRDDILKNMHLLGYILIIAGIPDMPIRNLLRSGSKIILAQKGIETLFQYWVGFQDLDSELYPNITDIPEIMLSDYAEKIDTSAMFNKNIAWLSKYNKKFLRDGFEGSDYNWDKLSSIVESAYKTTHSIYYRMNQKWYVCKTGDNASEDNKSISIIYHIHDPAYMYEVLTQHNTRVLYNNTSKHDRYIIINFHITSIVLQLFPFSQLDTGNYWFHFLLETKWKKRLTQFGKIGYALPKKVISQEKHLNNILLFNNELGFYIDNHLFDKSMIQLQKRYTPQYLEQLRKKHQKDLSDVRILIFASRYSTYTQYACETLDKGFKKIGCKSLLLKERKFQGTGFKVEFILRIIKNFRPDMLLSINNFRHDWAVGMLPYIPYITWIHDPPETLASPCLAITDNDFLFAASNLRIKELPEVFPILKNHPIELLPMVKDIDNSYPIVKEKKYDIGCITHLYLIPEVISYYEPEKRTDSAKELLVHRLLKQMEKLEPFEIASILVSKDKSLEFVQRGVTDLNISLSGKLEVKDPLVADTFRFGIGQFLQKTLSVRYLIEEGFTNIFLGGFGWSELSFFKPYAAGQIAHHDLPSISNNIAININPTAENTFHPRIGEMFEANSFVMSSWKGDADTLPITDCFIEDEEIVLYKTYKDLVKKTKYYLEHPEERETITQKGKEKFIRIFSPEIGCKTILNHVLGIDPAG
ncbi:MAG: glycosyltransferase [Proteobacteria bacterium]|nr:glycosyltransferase [Pseudomonadota bacterium]MBU1388916.1 glycosyltransferase [Pseudomonadota bacterium]MBU1543468.1 glycosyltransferase [Pseudomonadota bacterium]MBU2480530.1 glycosyltransferase [Pseudomonadota bacterium]